MTNAHALDSALAAPGAQIKLKTLWLNFITKGKTTKAHLKFLNDSKTEINIVESIPNSGLTSFYALYENGKIYISLEMLDSVITAIRKLRLGYDDSKLLEVVAQKTVDLIVHEIRHAITATELNATLKGNFPLPLEEDELLSYQEQARAIAEFQDPFFLTDIRTEVLDDMQTQLYSSYMGGSCDGYKDYIRQWNPVRSILAQPEELNKWFNDTRKMINLGLARLQERLREIRNLPASERDDELKQEEAKLVKTETDFLRNLEVLKISQEFINNEETFFVIQNFYREKVLNLCGSIN